MEHGYLWITLAVLLALLEVWAIKRIIGSPARAESKMMWIVFVVFVPVLGLLAWGFAGPRSRPGVPLSKEG
ncbi:PLD nuclease N-terminal domain-containing protein [Pseudomonas sp. 148P]|uniref:PLD nuclease N-terminal domain-containing protein n=1 Tax=Pseudomonas ulcerans TaxID=3115852 RepID=A0ABU7HKV1_9PSED|nr:MULTISPECIES: PLD nuclease N-terminal domain-containing protein [unclassified Pseudomonas]MEE1920949.1 PLD nuclease N-terminal domain-containing protein [Pseudomonas sp. 147P]MEE1932150.1 PLD nuclease N-terminal domain-containing protein [Pseudomonas sp. 148P]